MGKRCFMEIVCAHVFITLFSCFVPLFCAIIRSLSQIFQRIPEAVSLLWMSANKQRQERNWKLAPHDEMSSLQSRPAPTLTPFSPASSEALLTLLVTISQLFSGLFSPKTTSTFCKLFSVSPLLLSVGWTFPEYLLAAQFLGSVVYV